MVSRWQIEDNRRQMIDGNGYSTVYGIWQMVSRWQIEDGKGWIQLASRSFISLFPCICSHELSQNNILYYSCQKQILYPGILNHIRQNYIQVFIEKHRVLLDWGESYSTIETRERTLAFLLLKRIIFNYSQRALEFTFIMENYF